MNRQPKIAVLLATYNGAKFLAQQLDSILQQTWSNLVIVIRDDGSTDNTGELIRAVASENPDRVCRVEVDGAHAGAKNNFSDLIEYVLEHKVQLGLERAYMMFSDQDDIWQPVKMERQARLMFQVEGSETDTPVLVHCDLHVVNAGLQPVADSFIRYQGLDARHNGFGQLLISNLITGCTMLINEAVAEKAIPVPAGAIMHDWWLGLVAAAYGEIAFLPEPLVEYRQHENNALGAREHSPASLTDRELLRKIFYKPYTPLFAEVATQAETFLVRFHADLTYRQRVYLRMTMGLRSKFGHLQRILFRLLRLLPG